ncbi:glycosyltransferase family 2 protein [candidate division WOR-3 bacterium]|uniref:Glycosyltransferase family 2 protein n=1 Tax=candidate division WOR-3 bacterium TaxID=2052148 RepID=A0A937XHN0_UNCW3|nr:glycosyltransferase family 2 protein [candidate division WOR-3 bacterium]
MPPDLTVIFISYNSARLLERALSTLRDAEPLLRFEVLVVDNGSLDRERLFLVCRENGARLLALNRNMGIGAAANRGLRYARGRYVAVGNPDLVFTEGAVSALVRFMDMQRDAGVVSPQFVYADGCIQPSARRLPRMRYIFAGRRSPLARISSHLAPSAEFLYSGADMSASPVAVEAVIGAFMVFRREALEQAGAFDERYFMYAEDMDICRRIGRDWRVFLLPTSRIVHLVGQTRRQFVKLSEFHRLRSHRLFFRDGALGLRAIALDVLFSYYLACQQAARLVGVNEFEYSWAQHR